MNLIDLFIIYLACGAPFGVYYFLQNRLQNDSIQLWLKTFLSFLFWIPFALLLLRRKRNFKRTSFSIDKTFSAEANRQAILYSVQKRLEKILLASDLKISIYECREIIERYIGLTIIKSSVNSKIPEREKEIFRISKPGNVELGAICFARRNRKRLFFHQIEARKDFLHLIEKLSDVSSNEIEQPAIELVNFLEDLEARDSLKKMFADSLQSERRESVKRLEKDLWKPEKHKPLPIKPISIPLQVLTATISLRKKD